MVSGGRNTFWPLDSVIDIHGYGIYDSVLAFACEKKFSLPDFHGSVCMSLGIRLACKRNLPANFNLSTLAALADLTHNDAYCGAAVS